MEAEIQYVKPNEEVYKIKQHASIDPVRRVPLWLLIPLLVLAILGGYMAFMSVGMETTGANDL